MSFSIPIAFFDPPLVLDTSITPLPAISSSPLQVIANTGLNVGVGINYSDSTGDFIGLYIGLSGQEQLVCIFGNGLTGQAWGKIPPYSRVCLKSMKNVPITFGLLTATVITV